MRGSDAATIRASERPPGIVEGGELPRGTTLDRYVILKRLGDGGMGVVYLAFDGELDRRVAIKVLRPQAVGDVSALEARARLLREAQAMAKVSHPNVVSVYDVGTFGDEIFVAMEFVSGATLREWRNEQKRGTRAILDAYLQAGRGLEAAHAAGILHRDFKPENVVVDERGQVKVLDFGLARLETMSDAAGPKESAGSIALRETGPDLRAGLGTPLTRFGAIMGTPGYMAPEQLVGGVATAKSDQFAFSVALYEALFGELPFEGDNIVSLVLEYPRGALPAHPPRHGRPGPRAARARAGPRERAGEAVRLDEAAPRRAGTRRADPRRRWAQAIAATALVALPLGVFATRFSPERAALRRRL